MKKLFYFASIAALALSSCSKDNTDAVVTPTAGETAFIASMDLGGEATRNHINEKFQYAWDMGDMVVVNSDSQPNKKLPFITVNGGPNAAFTAVEEDLDYLGATGTYYMAYPYSQNISVENADPTNPGNGTIKGLTIPQEQRYRKNSFATMTAPSYIAADAATVQATTELKFHAAASYFEFPVKGEGTLTNLSMSITNTKGDGQAQQLWGTFDVIVTNTPDSEGNSVYTYRLSQPYDQSTNTEVTVDFGDSGLVLGMNQAQKVVFVINSGICIDGATINYTAKITKTAADGTTSEITESGYYVYPSYSDIIAGDVLENPYQSIKSNDYVLGKAVALGLGGANLINTEDEFITWAFMNWAVKNPTAPGALNVTIPDEWKGENNNAGQETIKGAVIADNLDFAGYVPNPNNPDIFLDDQFRNIAYNALTWYKNNVEVLGYGFKTLTDADITGVSDDITIANAVFDGLAVASGTLKNLVWDNITVKKAYSTESSYKGDYLFGNLYNNIVKLEDKVTVKGGALAAEGAIAPYAAASVVPALVIDGYPTNAEFVADWLVMDVDLDASVFYADNTIAFEKVMGSVAGKVLAINGTENFSDNVISTIPMVGNWFSLMMDGTSYWTGYVADAVRAADAGLAEGATNYGAYFTAEELAKSLMSKDQNIVLTNDIVLNGHLFVTPAADAPAVEYPETDTEFPAVDNRFNWSRVVYAAVNNTFNGKKSETENYTISDAALMTTGYTYGGYATLLGKSANISNLNVKNVTIAVYADEMETSGLAITGSAKNVAVEDITIAVADAKKIKSHVGGVFAYASVNKLEGVSAKNVIISYAEGVNTGSAGVVVGMATVDTNDIKTDIKGIVVDGDNSVANTLNQVMGKTRKDITWLSNNGTNKYSGAYAFGMLYVNNVDGIVINKTTSHTHTLVADANCSFGERIAAGITFPDSFINSNDHKFDKKNVCVGNVDATGKEVVQNHNYMLKSVGLYTGTTYEPYSYIGLTSGAEVK